MLKKLMVFTIGAVAAMAVFGPGAQAAFLGNADGAESNSPLADIPGISALADAVGFAQSIGEQAEAANHTWEANFTASCLASVGTENADLCDVEWVTPEPGATAQEGAENRAAAFEQACLASVGTENADLCEATNVTQDESEAVLADLMND